MRWEASSASPLGASVAAAAEMMHMLTVLLVGFADFSVAFAVYAKRPAAGQKAGVRPGLAIVDLATCFLV